MNDDRDAGGEPEAMDYSDGVSALTAMLEREPTAPPARDERGRFQGRPGDNGGPRFEDDEEADNADARDAAAKEKAEAPAAEGAEEAEDLVEWELDGEDGKPVRMSAPLAELISARERAAELEAEVQSARRQPPPPDEYFQAMQEAGQQRIALARQLHELDMMLGQVRPPDESLINPADQRYDPNAYFEQLKAAQQQNQRREQVRQQMAQLEREHAAANEHMMAGAMRRAHEFVAKEWPELRDPKMQPRLVEAALTHFGIPREVFNGLHDPVQIAVLRDALRYRMQGEVKEQVAKKVVAKPRLVRNTAAAGPRNSRQQTVGRAVERLARTGAREDGVAALMGLLN
jgi:hypothetical protein